VNKFLSRQKFKKEKTFVLQNSPSHRGRRRLLFHDDLVDLVGIGSDMRRAV
jgi:hypothetical protein